MSSNPTEDVRKDMANRALSEFNKIIADGAAVLSQPAEHRTRVIYVGDFEKYFYPHMVGKTTREEGATAIRLWLENVANHNESVQCLDDDKNVLFIIPPVFNSQRIVNLGEEGRYLTDVDTQATKDARNLPFIAQKRKEASLLDSIERLTLAEGMGEGWEPILEYFGDLDSKDKSNTATSTVDSLFDD